MGETSQSVEDEEDDLPSFHTSLDLSIGKADVGHGLVQVHLVWLWGAPKGWTGPIYEGAEG